MKRPGDLRDGAFHDIAALALKGVEHRHHDARPLIAGNLLDRHADLDLIRRAHPGLPPPPLIISSPARFDPLSESVYVVSTGSMSKAANRLRTSGTSLIDRMKRPSI